MIKIIAGGKRHFSWVAEACSEYEKRLRKPFELDWQLVEEEKLEKAALEAAVGRTLILLDERGEILDSPALSKYLGAVFEARREVVFVIGGAYGVGVKLRERADLVWSLSRLVFPHQICRLIVAEQIYRAQEIYFGRPYHHE